MLYEKNFNQMDFWTVLLRVEFVVKPLKAFPIMNNDKRILNLSIYLHILFINHNKKWMHTNLFT